MPLLQFQIYLQYSSDIADWTSENKMVLNKTKTLLVTGKRLEKKIPDKALKIACNGSEIGQVSGKSLHRSYLG